MTTGSYTYDAALATNVEQRHNVVNAHSSISSWVEAAGRVTAAARARPATRLRKSNLRRNRSPPVAELHCVPCPAATLSR